MMTTDLPSFMESTLLSLDTRPEALEKLCKDALNFGFKAVMVYPTDLAICSKLLENSAIILGTVIGFPSGRFSLASKLSEITEAHKQGAHEVDAVMQYGLFFENRDLDLFNEIKSLTDHAHGLGLTIKIIVETCYLNSNQKRQSLEFCENAGVDFIKTSTGFGSAGAQEDDIIEWKASRTTAIGIKASGGIRNREDALKMIAAGATRIGTSKAVEICAKQ
jgi:deoxyribose-phosphate aldolase